MMRILTPVFLIVFIATMVSIPLMSVENVEAASVSKAEVEALGCFCQAIFAVGSGGGCSLPDGEYRYGREHGDCCEEDPCKFHVTATYDDETYTVWWYVYKPDGNGGWNVMNGGELESGVKVWIWEEECGGTPTRVEIWNEDPNGDGDDGGRLGAFLPQGDQIMPGLGIALAVMPLPPQSGEYLQVNASNASDCPIKLTVRIKDYPNEEEGDLVMEHECDCPADNCQHGFFLPADSGGYVLSVLAEAGNPVTEFTGLGSRNIL